MPDFFPSQVVLAPGSPLAATMSKAEVEHAAAVLVRVNQFHGDHWRPRVWTDAQEALRSDQRDARAPFGGVGGFLTNPFFRPAFDWLVDGGWATRRPVGALDEFEFTEKGFEALKKWVRSPEVA